MIIWQINATQWDSNHKMFVIAPSSIQKGRTKKSKSIVTWEWASAKRNMYYFYLELIK